MNNYNTKFYKGEKVNIVSGFFKGMVGKVTDYIPQTTRGMHEDNLARGILEHRGKYTVKVGVFKSVYAEEHQLESLEVLKRTEL